MNHRSSPKIEQTFGRIFFSAVMLACLLVVLNGLFTGSLFQGQNGLFYFGVSAVIITAIISFRLPSGWQGKMALVGASLIGSVYFAELFFFATIDNITRAGIARGTLNEKNIPIDTRQQLDVVRDLQAQGIEAYPSIFTSIFRATNGIPTASTAILPLNGVANSTIVMCNEVGTWQIIQSDEHGFSNPTGIHAAESVDIALIGDSFAHGWCVPEDKNIATHLRQKNPSLLNLGVSGHGPLAELATFIEYAEPLQPKIVIWFYFEGNDFRDLHDESRSTILTSYLSGERQQDLRNRQDEIDAALIDYFKQTNYQYQSLKLYEKKANLSGIWRLANIQETLRNWQKAQNKGALTCTDNPSFIPTLSDTLTIADQKASSWGGQIIFVYLPDAIRYQNPSKLSQQDDFCRAEVLSIANTLNFPIVDFDATLSSMDDPLSAYPYEFGFHYNEFGYQLLADQIIKQIELTP